MSNVPIEQKVIDKPRTSWLWYGGEILTIFFALAVLTGRVYAQSYWNVFGLSTEIINISFINYAIMSPNVVLASMLMAAGTVALLVILFRRQPLDIVGGYNPRTVYIIGWLVFGLGLYATLVLKVDSSTWISGTAGMVFGLGYLITIGGLIAWIQAALKGQEKQKSSKIDQFLFGWVRKVPFLLLQVIFAVGIISSSLLGILDTAQSFGANEAKFMYNVKPWATIQLDSPKGFEDFASSSPSGATNLRVKVIMETGAFLYVSPGLTKARDQLYVRVVPTSRIQAIQYEVGATPIGH